MHIIKLYLWIEWFFYSSGQVQYSCRLINNYREYITNLLQYKYHKENAQFTISRYYEELCLGYNLILKSFWT